MSFSSYNGSIKLGAGLTPAGTGYPLMQSCDIQVDEEGKRLDEELEELRTSGGSVDVDSIVEQVLAKLPSDSPLPIEILTETEMTAILENATSAGAVYKYMGETGTYTQGELYIIQEE